MWLTTNNMFVLGNYWNELPTRFLTILKLPLLYSGIFKVSKNALWHFVPNGQPKHVITSTIVLKVLKIIFKKKKLTQFFIFTTLYYLKYALYEGFEKTFSLHQKEELKWKYTLELTLNNSSTQNSKLNTNFC